MSTKDMLRKASTGARLLKADGDAGVVTVAFAQLQVVDHDGDVTEPGAFVPGQKVKVCQTGHAHGKRVAGCGEIIGEQDIDGATWAVATLKFFLDTEAGEQEYKTVKALDDAGHTQEWSYGYDILAAAPGQADGRSVQVLKSLSVYEISPVLRGAGIGTHTLGVKAKDGECEACGQALPKADTTEADAKAADAPDACADCSKSPAECACEKDEESSSDADADAKWRALDVVTRFEVTRAKALGVRIE